MIFTTKSAQITVFVIQIRVNESASYPGWIIEIFVYFHQCDGEGGRCVNVGNSEWSKDTDSCSLTARLSADLEK